jgi:RNA polymerase sigma-70 factor (ECF subfamily)
MASRFSEQDDDDLLIRRFQASGDNSLFGEIFLRHHREIFFSCRNVVRNDSVAEDITQETFVVAFKNIAQYKGGRLRAWLRQIAIYRSINWLRSPTNRRFAGLDDLPYEPSIAPENISRSLDLEVACERLPPAQRQAVELHYYAGLSYKEIACQLGISEDAVTSHLQNGRRRLRLDLEGGVS